MSITATVPYRKQTRMERYRKKMESGETKTLPIQACCFNFGREVNFAQALRSSACFGVEILHLIGNCTFNRGELKAISGTTNDIVNVIYHKTPVDFILWCRENNVKIVSLELPSDSGISAEKIQDYNFNFSNGQKYVIVSGAETFGLPTEILYAGDCVYIEMFGAHCLNTAQALCVGIFESSRQYTSYCESLCDN